MKKFTKQALAIVAIAAFAVAGCKKGNEGSFGRTNGAGGPFSRPDSIITGNITGRVLGADKTYRIEGIVFVTSGTLTIKPGALITSGAAKDYRVSPTSPINSIKGVLVITKTAAIDAIGTPSQPIVFTTPNSAGSRHAGDFGGLIVLGESLTNKPATTVIEGLPTFDGNGNSLGVDITYGGGVSADNSGTIRYTRIEYAGFKLAQDNEVNGLTLGGVGSGTHLDHIQVSYGADDAFEFFGGTVDASYLLALGNDDDDFDTDFGYSGHIRFAIGLKDPASTHSQTATGTFDSNGIESDNDNLGDNSATPKTKPTYENFTILGFYGNADSLARGNRWRRNTDLLISNSIIAGYNTAVDFLNGTVTGATPGGFNNNVVHGYAAVFNTSAAVSIGAGNTPLTGANVNDNSLKLGGIIDDSTTPAKYTNPFYTTATSADYAIDLLQPSEASSFVGKGAVTSESYGDWTSGWVNFSPQTSVD